MAANKWAGLATNASPYAIPEGAAVEQTNLSCVVPGQLTSRGGMRPVTYGGSPANESRDCYQYVFGNGVQMLVLNAAGEIVQLGTPAYGSEPTSPNNPTLSPSAGQVQSSYTGAFYDANEEAPP